MNEYKNLTAELYRRLDKIVGDILEELDKLCWKCLTDRYTDQIVEMYKIRTVCDILCT